MKGIPLSTATLRAIVAACFLAAILAAALGLGSSSPAPAAESSTAPAAPRAELLDDYSDPARNKRGVERLLIDDKSAGSQSCATTQCENGILVVQGELSPGRGVPAFISVVSPLSPDGKPRNLAGFEGVRLRAKVGAGLLCVQVASSEIDNFDYHTSAPIAVGKDGFQEVRVPFQEMRRAWSAQTRLNVETITSVNLVSFGMAKGAFAYEVDEIGFY